MNMHAECVLRSLLDDAAAQATSNDAYTSSKLCTDVLFLSYSPTRILVSVSTPFLIIASPKPLRRAGSTSTLAS